MAGKGSGRFSKTACTSTTRLDRIRSLPCVPMAHKISVGLPFKFSRRFLYKQIQLVLEEKLRWEQAVEDLLQLKMVCQLGGLDMQGGINDQEKGTTQGAHAATEALNPARAAHPLSLT